MQACKGYTRVLGSNHCSFSWLKSRKNPSFENYLLLLVRCVGDSKGRSVGTTCFTMDCRWTELRFVMLGDDIHIRYSRNLAGRGRVSMSGGSRMSTGDRSHENNG